MKTLLTAALLVPLLGSSHKLTPRYEAEQAWRTRIELAMELEMTRMEVEVDGEPQEAPGHGGKNSLTMREEHVDTVIQATDGRASKVRRAFEKLSAKSEMQMGEMSSDEDIESPFEDVTLELTREGDDEVLVKVVDGKAPADEKALEGHQLESLLDGLLPKEDLEVDASYEPESAAVARALRFDLRNALLPRKPKPGGLPSQGGRLSDALRDAEWRAKATLKKLDEELDGRVCALIELELRAKGSMEIPMPAMGGGRLFAPPAFERTMDFSVEFKGTLHFATQERRALKLELEGSISTETRLENDMGGRKMNMLTAQSGTFEYTVAVAPVDAK